VSTASVSTRRELARLDRSHHTAESPRSA
jgi:hypothetical protein